MQYKKILCPIDLSDNNAIAIELATTTAKQHGAVLTFLFVSDLWPSNESLTDHEYIDQEIDQQKKELYETHPADGAVACDHVFLQGNPGPKIVEFANDFDLVIMSTQGRNAIARLLLGSVAEYTMRHSTCPVVIVNHPDPAKSAEPMDASRRFVTSAMHHTCTVHDYEKMDLVIPELERSNMTSTPVVDGLGKCIGILTQTDINQYVGLKTRFANNDESVLPEMFDSNQYGQRDAANHDFDQVKRHMTAPVVTISNTAAHQEAVERFTANPSIHHLIVVDHCERPVGVIVAKELVPDRQANSPS